MVQATILGTGELATANAHYLAGRVERVVMYGRNAGLVEIINSSRTHPRHFSNVRLPDNVSATTDPEHISTSQLIFVDLHSTGIREVAGQIAPYVQKGTIIVNDSKGLESGTHRLPLEIVAEELHGAYLVARSGWMPAANLFRGKSYVDIACTDIAVAEYVSRLVRGSGMHTKTTTDVTGVQLAGCIKNVFLILMGMISGMEEARPYRRVHGPKSPYREARKIANQAATIEAQRIVELLGGNPRTIGRSTHAWMDFAKSCKYRSLNFFYGYHIGLGTDPDTALDIVTAIRGRRPEGYHTTKELYELTSGPIKTPILHHTYTALYEGQNAVDAFVEGAQKIADSGRFRKLSSRIKRAARTIGKLHMRRQGNRQG